jgi:hypothetical protein
MELSFEYTIRMFLGDKAFHIAGLVHNPKHRKKYFRQAIKQVLKQIDRIDTNTAHKKRLFSAAQSLLSEFQSRKLCDITVSIKFLRLVGILLGYSGVKGAILNTPFYYQTPGQHHTETILNRIDTHSEDNEKNVIAKRTEIIGQLKSDGMTDFDIALILNTSEYQIKKLRRQL